MDGNERGGYNRRAFLVCIGLGCLLFVLLGVSVASHASWISLFDSAVQTTIFPLRSNMLTAFCVSATHLAGTRASICLAVVFAVVLAVVGSKKHAGVYLLCVVGGEAFITAVKFIVGRLRPLGMNLINFPSDASFPSGHTFASIAVVSFGIFVLVRLLPHLSSSVRVVLWGFAIVWPVFIAFTRVYLGVHWPTDVLASLILGWCIYFPIAWLGWARLTGSSRRNLR